MKLNMVSRLVSIFVLSWSVDAGHSSWEPLNHVSGTSNAISGVQKRWFTILPSENGVHLWDKGTIRYCFENEQTKEKLLYDLEAARDRWYFNSLPENDFQLTEVSDAVCKSDRANVLLIKYNDQGYLATTPGIPPLDAKDKKYEGPTMSLSDKEDVGLLEVIGNYAHELGHAWGLLHEHQNPAFWTAPYSAGQTQIFTWNCQNLKDWKEVSGRLTDPDDQQQLCESRAFAHEQKFSAAEYLPFLGGQRAPSVAIAGDDDVDWKSIMLYPSGAGAVGAAAPGNDQRAPILLKRSDGSRIPINLDPSDHDVQALKDLYGIDWPRTRPSLISEPGNPKSSTFRNILRKQHCS